MEMDELKEYEVTKIGKIRIAPQVIEMIAKQSTLEIEGVVDLSGSFAGEIKEFLGRNKHTVKGIKVEVGEAETSVDVSVVIKYGYNITEIAEKIQENVKTSIENMTGLNVVKVNVHINGIEFEEKDNDKVKVK